MHPSKDNEVLVTAIVAGIRACFGRLRAVADALHGDLGVTASMRAVMEAVVDGDGLTVPQIARAKRVSRQNIQVIADALAAAGLVDLVENPAHRRSPHVVLTARGKSIFREMRRRERFVLRAIAEDLTRPAAEAALETLQAIQRRLELLEKHTEREKEEVDADA
jgi:DNA-binding MarR family transcriptional regulator